MKILRSGLFCLLAGVTLLCCNSPVAGTAETDPVYGKALRDVYRERKVKEVFIELDHYYERKLVYPRFLNEYRAVDKTGLVYRREIAHANFISTRIDMEYDAKGNLDVSTSFTRTNKIAEGVTGRENITWVESTQRRYNSSLGKAAGEYRWDTSAGKWKQQTEERTWIKNDTTYTETRPLYAKDINLKEVSRTYQSGEDPSVLRTDYLTFSPKGLREPSYRYYKIENGKMTESGNVDFEAELFHYLEQHPADQMRVFGSESRLYHLLDKVARQYPGQLQPDYFYTYNTAGQLVAKKELSTETTYVRDANGRAVTIKESYMGSGGRTITYNYNAEGLIQTEVSTYANSAPETTKHYRYTYY